MYNYRLMFSKTGIICYVGHLDLMTAIRRAIKRAELPVKYSTGFNPHMELSIAMPITLGMEGFCEYADLVLTLDIDESEVVARLNEQLPSGLFVHKAEKSKLKDEKNSKIKTAAALVRKAEYMATVKNSDLIKLTKASAENYFDCITKAVTEVKEASEVMVLKKTKSGESIVNIRADIYELDTNTVFDVNGKIESIIVNMTLAAGSERNLKPELIMNYLLDKIGISGLKIRYARVKLVLA